MQLLSRLGHLPNTILGVLVVVGALSAASCGLLSRTVSSWGRPVLPPKYLATSPVLPNPELAVLWAGHATVLFQIHEKVFLTDPVFSRSIGMLARRRVDPGLDPKTLSRVDYTLISHTHMDHFDFESLDALPKDGKLLLPLGALRYTPDLEFAELHDLNPGQTIEDAGVRITAVRVNHFGGRYGLDMAWMRETGFTGYIVSYRGVTVFFAGDTAYDPELFKELRENYQIDLAILPIAPIEPRDFMRKVHVDPAEALQIMTEVDARFMVPIHHSTFDQGADAAPEAPLAELGRVARRRKLAERVIALQIGEQRLFSFWN